MTGLPEGQRIFAIGDIHGCLNLLDDLIERIVGLRDRRGPAAGEDRLIFLGDYIDRGPDSCGVVERLLTGLPVGFVADFLMGNHERMLLDCLDESSNSVVWLLNGGAQALDSYRRPGKGLYPAINPRAGLRNVLPAAHVAFFEALKLHVTFGDYAFVHAGIRPGRSLADQDEQDLLWIREPFLSYTEPFERFIVHGHTPRLEPDIQANRIGIDTGAVFSGRLTALVLEGDQLELLST
jgi:serine/threonine protein phosphatase 1